MTDVWPRVISFKCKGEAVHMLWVACGLRVHTRS